MKMERSVRFLEERSVAETDIYGGEPPSPPLGASSAPALTMEKSGIECTLGFPSCHSASAPHPPHPEWNHLHQQAAAERTCTEQSEGRSG